MRHLAVLLATTAACTSTVAPPSPPDPPGTCDAQPAEASALRLLTRAEYDRTVEDLLGDTTRPARAFPREPKAFGFENNAAIHVTTAEAVEAFNTAAEAVAARAVKDHRSLLVTCSAGEDEKACGARFVGTFGARAFRRPLSTAERASLQTVFDAVHAAEGFDAGLEAVVATLLQSPQFLYVVQPGSAGLGPLPKSLELDGYELASRLSYFLWGTMPDDALLAAAGAHKLDTPEGLEAEARRLLASPKAQAGVDEFVRQWLELDAFDSLTKAPASYADFAQPEWNARWKQSLALFARDALLTDGTLHGLMTRPVVYADATLAKAYALEGHSGGDQFEALSTDPRKRAGLLTQPALLARLAGPDQSSPVRRGLFVLAQLMCQPLPPPPATFNIVPPMVDQTSTTRQRFTQHSARAECHSCHQIIDPAGFGFEHFDGVGAWRDQDNGQPVDATGTIVKALRDAQLEGDFQTVPELAERLARSPQVMNCMATTAFRYGLGRVESPQDLCALEGIQATFQSSGGRWNELLVAIVKSDGFRLRKVPEVSP